jgi:protein-S-isoprenylcysteine O-methyltransferase Ste14
MHHASIAPWQVLTFVVASSLLIYVSRKPLSNLRCHGFYRFFAFEATLVVLLLNLPYWHDHMLASYQLVSWAILAASATFVTSGLWQLRKYGGQRTNQIHAENFAFENTERLVTSGIFRHIRHPMYSALLLLAWGGLLKNLTLPGLTAALLASAALLLTALTEERENLAYFGENYRKYMHHSKRFIPFLF